MKYGVCIVSVAPIRAEASDRSEMVTQLLFGEKVEIISVQEKWIKVMADYDAYVGWVDTKQVLEVSPTTYQQLDTTHFSADLFNLLMDGEFPSTLTLAAPIYQNEETDFQIGDKYFSYLGDVIDAQENHFSIGELAKLYLNTPYLWGGKSNFGIDCSGLVQQVFKLKNIVLPRDASQQATKGEVLSFVAEAQMGDLAFFDNEEGNIIHVGIILDDQKIIHAHGKVRIDPIDSTGIFNTDTQQYSHKLRFIKRVIEG